MGPSLGGPALKALTPQTAVRVDQSRCVRHRCNRNDCRKCLDVCPSGAIHWDVQGLQVVPHDCTQCLRCLAVCPTAALRSPELALLQMLSDLAAHPAPVLGCHCPAAVQAHARMSCLGYLANPELMLLLALIFPDGLQLNLTSCRGCRNGHILDGVHTAAQVLAAINPGHKIHLVLEPAALNFQPSVLSRRELFGLFRDRSKRTARLMVDRLQTASQQAQAYGSKQLPQVRTLLLNTTATLPRREHCRAIEQLFGTVTFTETCTACGGCAGVCPTGAIEPADELRQPPVFDSPRCVSCGSCQAFCRNQGVQVTAPAVELARLGISTAST